MNARPADVWLLLALAAVLALLPVFGTGYTIYIANLLMVYVVLALGLHIVLGEAGQFALSHAAFYGIGIYTAGLLTKLWQVPFPLGVVAGGLVAAAMGYVIGWLALRMRDIYLALATYAFGEAMQWVFLNWESVTGGSNGLQMAPARIFGMQLTSDLQAYPFVIGMTAVMLALTVAIARSQFGSALRAVRESDMAAMAMGIDVRAAKRAAFALSAAWAGIAGGITTTFMSFIHPESLGSQTTILILTMVVVGGLGTVRGAVCGAIAFGLISELLRQTLSLQEIIYGGILLAFMMFRPGGLLSGRRTRAAMPS